MSNFNINLPRQKFIHLDFPLQKNQSGQLKGHYLLLTRQYHYQISFWQAKVLWLLRETILKEGAKFIFREQASVNEKTVVMSTKSPIQNHPEVKPKNDTKRASSPFGDELPSLSTLVHGM